MLDFNLHNLLETSKHRNLDQLNVWLSKGITFQKMVEVANQDEACRNLFSMCIFLTETLVPQYFKEIGFNNMTQYERSCMVLYVAKKSDVLILKELVNQGFDIEVEKNIKDFFRKSNAQFIICLYRQGLKFSETHLKYLLESNGHLINPQQGRFLRWRMNNFEKNPHETQVIHAIMKRFPNAAPIIKRNWPHIYDKIVSNMKGCTSLGFALGHVPNMNLGVVSHIASFVPQYDAINLAQAGFRAAQEYQQKDESERSAKRARKDEGGCYVM